MNDAAFHTAQAEVENQYIRARVVTKSLVRLLREILEAVENDTLTEYKKHKLSLTKALLEGYAETE